MTPVEIIRGVFNPACAFTGKETEESEILYPPVHVEDSFIEGLACLFKELPPNPSRGDIAAWLKTLLDIVRSSTTWVFPHSITLLRDHGALQVLNPGTVRTFNFFFMRLRQLLLRGLLDHDDVVEALRGPPTGMIPVFSAVDKENLRVTLKAAVNRETARVAAEAARAEDARVAAASALAELASVEVDLLAEMAPFEMDPLLLDVSRWVPPPPVPPGSPQLPPQVTAVPPGSPPVPPLVIRSKKKACPTALGFPRRVKKRACPQALPIDGASAIPAKRQKAIAHVREVEPVAESGEAPAAPVAACDDLIERAFRTTLNEYTYFELPRSIIEAMLKRPATMSPISHAYSAAIPIAGRTVDKDKAWDFARVLREAIQAVCEECKLTNDKPNILRDIVKITINAILQHGGINETLGYKGVYWWQTILKSP